jgi:hypothetical protein
MQGAVPQSTLSIETAGCRRVNLGIQMISFLTFLLGFLAFRDGTGPSLEDMYDLHEKCIASAFLGVSSSWFCCSHHNGCDIHEPIVDFYFV